MAVSEKQVTVRLSYGAVGVATVIAVAFWFAGLKNPRAYATTMAINHHNGYGSNVACYECHIPTSGDPSGGFFTQVTCVTSGCHGELMPGTKREDAIAMFSVEKSHLPDIQARAEHHLGLHAATSALSCWECHHEHDSGKASPPAGWTTYAESISAAAPPAGDQLGWVSLRQRAR